MQITPIRLEKAFRTFLDKKREREGALFRRRRVISGAVEKRWSIFHGNLKGKIYG